MSSLDFLPQTVCSVAFTEFYWLQLQFYWNTFMMKNKYKQKLWSFGEIVDRSLMARYLFYCATKWAINVKQAAWLYSVAPWRWCVKIKWVNDVSDADMVSLFMIQWGQKGAWKQTGERLVNVNVIVLLSVSFIPMCISY